jgi:hypothetical protein
LKRIKGEVDVGLKMIDLVIKILENSGLGQGSKVQQELGQKGKEKIEAEGIGLKHTREFKPKKKMSFKPKGVVGSGVGLKGVKPSSCFQLVEKLLDSMTLRTCLARESSLAGGSSSTCMVGVALPFILGSFEWVCEDLLAGLKTDDLVFTNSAFCKPKMGRTEAGVVFGSLGPFEASDSPQTVPVEVSGWAFLVRAVRCQ